jgi:predicted nucleic acid-binding protein
MSGSVFVDTNVIVYSRDTAAGPKQAAALDWLRYLWETRRGRTSFQVLQEYYVAVTEKLNPGITAANARKDVASLIAWQPVRADARVLKGAWDIQDRYRFSWWDALIVSAALEAKCRFLLTEDLQPKQTVGNLTILNPFETSPSSL